MDWIKNKLGIGDGPRARTAFSNGMQRKAEAEWDAIKAKIEAFKKHYDPRRRFGGIAMMVSPGDQCHHRRHRGRRVARRRWIQSNWGKGNMGLGRALIRKNLEHRCSGR